MTKIFIRLSRLSLKKVERELFFIFNLLCLSGFVIVWSPHSQDNCQAQAQALSGSYSVSVTVTKIMKATHHHPTTFKHEGGVPHKNPKVKTDLE